MSPLPIPRAARRLVAAAGALAVCASPSFATWSIVAVDTRTGEVAVASATCLINTRLHELVPVITVGRGAGAAQSSGDALGINRAVMFNGFQAGWTAEEIFDEIEVNGAGNLQGRQFGIVSMEGDPFTFTGTKAGAAALGVTGTIGTIRYAIQGNVLAGDPVIYEAERAFRASGGDLAQRFFASMEAARVWGGDGRCSCAGPTPTSCGSPPASFNETNLTAFVFIARIGDTDGTCTANGCATGNYYMRISRKSQPGQLDPVLKILDVYEGWRENKKGRPDHILSSVQASAVAAPADGSTRVDYTVSLADIDGALIGSGGAQLTVTPEVGGLVSLSPITDNGDGTYAFSATSGTAVGTEALRIVADDGTGPVTLYPFTELKLDPVDRLHVGIESLSALSGGSAPFVIQDPSQIDSPFILLGTAAGRSPGQTFGSLSVPLNADALFQATLIGAGGPLLPGSVGVLDDTGRSEASFVAPAGLLSGLIEERLEWSVVFLGKRPAVSNGVGFDLVP